ncbi:MAG: eight-cysteine-cluster domain-containing protein [Archaeoglobaceae archaeon]
MKALAFAIAIAAVVFILLMPKNFESKPSYEVLECKEERGYESYFTFDSISRSIIAKVVVNCGSDEIRVEKGEFYRIVEKDYDGVLYRCLCVREVRIYNAEKIGVEFINIGGESVRLKEKVSNFEGFCGWSTFSKCKSDADCKAGGCSAQVCMGVNEEIVTTCEYRECYNSILYGVGCRCVNGACQWVKI